MPVYSDELISEICSRNDIIDYVSMYVQLKRSGKDYSGLCPFHHEKSPSFHVNREKQLFHCFGCGASGNLIQFVMRSESLDFVDALKLLADRAGIALPEKNYDFDNELHKKRKRFLEMNKTAARFFYENLVHGECGAAAREYIRARGVTPKTLTCYGLGYAPDSYDALLKHLESKGYTAQEAVENSLAVSRSDRIYDKFRDRVMFPIIDVRGNIIGFGGRIINDKQTGDYKPPKYLNSGETIVFDKGRNLFSLNLAKNSDSSQLILCEGYMDVISVYQAGIKNTVATLGTAITPDQARLMMRYANEVVICYDMDEAGRTAALRAIDVINSVGGKSRVMKLRGVKDPDEYIKRSGAASFEEEVRRAVNSTEYKLSLVRAEHDITDTDGKIQYVADAVKALAGISSAAEVDAYIGRIASETDIGKDAVYSEYKKLTARNERRANVKPAAAVRQTAAGAGASGGAVPRARATDKKSTVYEAQRRLLAIMIKDKSTSARVLERLSPESYSGAVFARLAAAIGGCWQRGEIPDAAMIVNMFNDDIEAQNEAAAVFYNTEIYTDTSEAADELLRSIEISDIEEKISKCRDMTEMNELIRRLSELKNKSNTWEE